jgi:hypothetical protein
MNSDAMTARIDPAPERAARAFLSVLPLLLLLSGARCGVLANA